jgi:HEPN domain-containing protein
MARVDEWIERAKGSLEIAQVKIVGHIHYEDLCFQIQQAVEKALKGLLIFYGVEPEFTHNIELLLTELEKFTVIPQDARQAMKLTTYAVQTRYPGGYDDITKEEYEKAVKIAKDCLDWVENKIAGNNGTSQMRT